MLAWEPACGCTFACSAPKSCLGSLPRQVFHHIGELAAAVVAFARISLRIFISEYRTHGFKHGFADKVLGGDQLKAFVLAANFVIDSSSDLRIGFGEREGHWIGFHGCKSQYSVFKSRFSVDYSNLALRQEKSRSTRSSKSGTGPKAKS